jgi:hypothetical protein
MTQTLNAAAILYWEYARLAHLSMKPGVQSLSSIENSPSDPKKIIFIKIHFLASHSKSFKDSII